MEKKTTISLSRLWASQASEQHFQAANRQHVARWKREVVGRDSEFNTGTFPGKTIREAGRTFWGFYYQRIRREYRGRTR